MLATAELSEEIQKQVAYRNPRALEFDINSVRSIFALRRGAVPRRLEDARAVLVTNNSALATAAFELGKNHNSSREVSVAITDYSLANVAWLKSPMDAPTLPEKETLAACYAAIEPDPRLWSTYLRELERLERQGTLTPDDHAILRSSSLAEHALMDLTLGDESMLKGGSVSSILERVKDELARDHAAAVVEEKAAHDLTKRRLRLAAEQRRRTEIALETFADRTIKVLYTIIAVLAVAFLFLIGLASSGLTGAFVGGSTIATGAINALVGLGILWSVYSSFTGNSVRAVLAESRSRVTRRLGNWLKERFIGMSRSD